MLLSALFFSLASTACSPCDIQFFLSTNQSITSKPVIFPGDTSPKSLLFFIVIKIDETVTALV